MHVCVSVVETFQYLKGCCRDVCLFFTKTNSSKTLAQEILAKTRRNTFQINKNFFELKRKKIIIINSHPE